ncbi:MAG: deoxyguanosinetriphosphate triphosphohydrolase [Lachnospiraceae bacterium]
MEWNKLLSEQRNGQYPDRNYPGKSVRKSTDLRSEFEKDYHRIIGSASFRRLQDKTQVFPLDKSDFIRTRLTHSLEVSSFAKSLGQNIAEYILQNRLDPSFTQKTKEDMYNILQCAGLIHDIGNPPFGHFGEEAIRAWFGKNLPRLTFKGRKLTDILTLQMQQDLYHFEGNAQALRLVSKLHFLVNEYGMNLTYGILNTIIKYPVSSLGINTKSGNIKDKKMGYFAAEEELFHRIIEATGAKDCRHPLTYVLEAADDIAYRTADIEDAYKKGCISYDTLMKELKKYQSRSKIDTEIFNPVGMLEHQYEKAVKSGVQDPRLYAVQNWVVRIQGILLNCATYGFTRNYREIMQGTYKKDIFGGTYGEWLIEALGEIAYQYAFISKPILKLEIAANSILEYFLDKFVSAALTYDTDENAGMMDQKFMSMISENYLQIYHYHAKGKTEAEKLYLRLLLVTDYVSGMTDSYAKNLYQELNGMVNN